MIYFREWMAVLIFCAGLGGIFSLFSSEFAWPMLMLTVFLFVAAYLVWPSKKKGQRNDDSSAIADIFELIIQFPVDLCLWLFRLLGRLLSSKFDGFDIGF